MYHKCSHDCVTAATSLSGPSAPAFVPTFELASGTGAAVYSLNASSTFTAAPFVNLTSLTLMLIGSRETPLLVATSASGTAPLTLASTGTVLVPVNFTDNRRYIRANAQYAVVPRYGITSATGGNVSSSTDSTLYFLTEFKSKMFHVS